MIVHLEVARTDDAIAVEVLDFNLSWTGDFVRSLLEIMDRGIVDVILVTEQSVHRIAPDFAQCHSHII